MPWPTDAPAQAGPLASVPLPEAGSFFIKRKRCYPQAVPHDPRPINPNRRRSRDPFLPSIAVSCSRSQPHPSARMSLAPPFCWWRSLLLLVSAPSVGAHLGFSFLLVAVGCFGPQPPPSCRIFWLLLPAPTAVRCSRSHP